MIEQRSQEWLKQRIGMVTASEFHNLMKNHKEEIPMTEEEIEAYKAEHPRAKNIPTTKKVDVPFSDATYTYLNRKVMERYIPDGNIMDEYIEDRATTSHAMGYGTLMESAARQRYSEEMGVEVVEVEFVTLKGFEKICGASADGIIREEKGGIEIKCPFSIEHHLDYLLLQTPQDLLELKPEYYWQICFNMLVWDLDYYDFVSFCPYVSRSKQLKVLRINRNKDLDKEIINRVKLASDYMLGKMKEINNISTIIK